jgi:succinate dehydrogenase / fumarate reductase cytochrome b subunit
MPNPRPKYLNLFEIRMPVPAFVSIVHRVTGAALFLLIPLLLYLLQLSLETPQTFAAFKSIVSQPLMKLVLIGLVWAYLHHFCAGIRHLALDLHFGVGLEAARTTSWVVLAVSIGLALVFGALIW